MREFEVHPYKGHAIVHQRFRGVLIYKKESLVIKPTAMPDANELASEANNLEEKAKATREAESAAEHATEADKAADAAADTAHAQ